VAPFEEWLFEGPDRPFGEYDRELGSEAAQYSQLKDPTSRVSAN
jgi:hypothetical protein